MNGNGLSLHCFQTMATCGICLNKMHGKVLGRVDGCDHEFCYGCIQQWSTRRAVCPLDGVPFSEVRRRINWAEVRAEAPSNPQLPKKLGTMRSTSRLRLVETEWTKQRADRDPDHP